MDRFRASVSFVFFRSSDIESLKEEEEHVFSFVFRSSDIESLKEEEENVVVDAPYLSTSISRTAERQKLFLRGATLPDFVKIRNT